MSQRTFDGWVRDTECPCPDCRSRSEAEVDSLRAERDHARAEVDRLDSQLASAFADFAASRSEVQSLKDAQAALWDQQVLAVAGWKRVCDELKAKLKQADEDDRDCLRACLRAGAALSTRPHAVATAETGEGPGMPVYLMIPGEDVEDA